MTTSVIIRTLIKSLLTSTIIFIITTLASYLLTRQSSNEFTLGFPFSFYEQFRLTGSDFNNFGWRVSNFIIDCLFTFLFSFLYVVWSEHKRQPIFRSLINTFSWTILGVWCLLTGIVVLFLIDRWMHPNTKRISNVDLLTYGHISIWLLGIFGIFRLVLMLLKFRQTKQSS